MTVDVISMQAGMTAKVISFNAAISACNGGCWKSALLLLHKMREIGMSASVVSFSAAISVCKVGVQREQFCLLQKMCDAGMTTNVISFKAAISACEKGGQWAQALVLLQPSQDDWLQGGHLSVQEGWAVEVGFAAALQDARSWHDCKCDQLQ